MPHFRAFPLDATGKITGCQDFDAANDDEAMHMVRLLSGEVVFEVWSGTRMVGRIDPPEVTAAVVPALISAPIDL